MGVVTDLGEHLLLGVTILSMAGMILVLGSSFLWIQESSSDISGATESASYGADLGGLASL